MRALSLTIAMAVLAVAQQPPISNAKLQTGSASVGLEPTVRSAIASVQAPFWIGYAVPAIAGRGTSCCWSDDARGCGLEGQRNVIRGERTGPVQLEGPSHVAVLLRVEGGEVRKIRAYSTDCPLDAGGLAVQWLTGVDPAQSVALLERHPDQAIHAIAMHRAPEADKSLERLATSGAEKQRKDALFWLANSRGRRGFEVVSRVAREDPSDRIREHSVFALTQSKEPQAVPTLILMAKEDQSARVRGQALFWLAQKASRESAKEIAGAIDNDPDTDVKKKAVFALSQLPREEGIPLLIQVARTHKNPAVRQQAMFWLGQSKDSRAVRFFEEVLTK